MGFGAKKVLVWTVMVFLGAWLAFRTSHAVRLGMAKEKESRGLACRQVAKGGMCDRPYFGVDQDLVHSLCANFDKTCLGSRYEVIMDHAAKQLTKELRAVFGEWVALGVGSALVVLGALVVITMTCPKCWTRARARKRALSPEDLLENGGPVAWSTLQDRKSL